MSIEEIEQALADARREILTRALGEVRTRAFDEGYRQGQEDVINDLNWGSK